jgi:hypothetical protein
LFNFALKDPKITGEVEENLFVNLNKSRQENRKLERNLLKKSHEEHKEKLKKEDEERSRKEKQKEVQRKEYLDHVDDYLDLKKKELGKKYIFMKSKVVWLWLSFEAILDLLRLLKKI